MTQHADRPPHIVAVFPGFGVGGAQIRFTSIANHFRGACRLSVISLNGDQAARAGFAPDLMTDFPVLDHPKGRMLAAIAAAARFLRAQAPDLVLTSNWGAMEWAIGARLAGLKLVHSEDGFGPEERSRQLPRRVLTRRFALRGSTVILPSRTLLRIATTQWRLPARQIHYIPNGIDLARFTGAAPQALPPGDGPVIGTIAALRAEKNIGRLLRAVARQPGTRLVIVGDGPKRPALQALAAELGIAPRTLFAGHQTNAENWLAAFDLFALSSDTEQMPISLLEAMETGLPTLCTDVGDVRAMLPAENAPFIVPAEDDAFAAGLARLLAADRRSIGAANRARAEGAFDQAGMFAAWGEVLGIRK